MCGIFGYIGTKDNAASTVLTGLKQLEYRGYDSWGIAIKNGDSIEVDKHVGKIGEATTSLKDSTLGIGHTRWATHGGVTIENAHPHLDCTHKIALIHNGIVENYSELKEKLIEKGHIFISETDSEAIVHQIEEYAKTESFEKAVKKTFNELRGMNAIVVADTKEHEIVAAKNGSPLIIGTAEDGFYLASDATGIIPHTRKLLFLKDHEMVKLNDHLTLYSLPDGKEIEPQYEMVDWDIEETDMGTYDHFMMKEIAEQPKVILNIANSYDSQIQNLIPYIRRAHNIFIIAAGTAYHAGLNGVYLFAKQAKKHIDTAVASEFDYLGNLIDKDSLVIALSQSGETIDVIDPLKNAQEKGATIVGITNSLGSTIYRMADVKILLGAGPEKAVASTKAYIAKLALLLLLVHTYTETDTIKKSLEQAAEEIMAMLSPDYTKTIQNLAKKLSPVEHIYTLGRGNSYPSALEAALKIKEISYIHTEGLAGGELKHGTIALIEKDTPVIVFAPEDETYEAMISNATEIKSRGGYIIGISSKPSHIFDEWIEVKNLENVTLLTQIVPAQLLAYYLALEKGYDPDKPRNLAKSVTVK